MSPGAPHREDEQLVALIAAAQAGIGRAVTVREIYAAGIAALRAARPEDQHHLLSIDAEQVQWIGEPPPEERPPWGARIPVRLSPEMLVVVEGPPAPAAQLLRHVLRSAAPECAQVRLDGLVVAVVVATPRRGMVWSRARRVLLTAVAAAMSAQLTRVVAVATGAPVQAAP